MKKTANSRKRPDGDKRMAVLRLELDYELATLYEAMMEKDEEKKKECKRRLEKLAPRTDAPSSMIIFKANHLCGSFFS
ncbi:Conserved hypothetical protein [Geobacillus thermodenitrificans NG80-2]|uniref:Uncharacterized protein n=1 Tax=Geobacillus thermodenitrificans (strain NG80-2) TaxID=420246 RepID=A4ILV6_GEOTN|nr:Conserved hypothetical protein [Geobacillus thermodenitrificans NG80-2]